MAGRCRRHGAVGDGRPDDRRQYRRSPARRFRPIGTTRGPATSTATATATSCGATTPGCSCCGRWTGRTSSAITSSATSGSIGRLAEIADFNGDGNADILWRNDDGTVRLWEMDGPTVIGDTNLGTFPAYWHVADSGDYNGDGNADILWRDDAGVLVMWEMDGPTILGNTARRHGPDHDAGRQQRRLQRRRQRRHPVARRHRCHRCGKWTARTSSTIPTSPRSRPIGTSSRKVAARAPLAALPLVGRSLPPT